MRKSSDIVGTVDLVSVAIHRVIRIWIAVARWPLRRDTVQFASLAAYICNGDFNHLKRRLM